MSGNEVRVVNPTTGGEKGAKDEAYSMLPWPQLREVARVYRMGAAKYERYNWMRGYDWSLGFDALLRHAEQWWSGEDTDEESGLSHMAHAVFHCLALMYFAEHHKELDDRPPTVSEPTWQPAPLARWKDRTDVAVLREYQSEDGQKMLADVLHKFTGMKYSGIDAGELEYL